ncbi:PilW family protein [Sporosarcina sp. Marseille-Q4943]|uniref:PilW family protein n=1 Tax=Sporosarcina sp. Marseille-Q4943 TaxID=2942204 RepID=UPI00208DAD72|nr:type II secretion system protein [Sporosarcina sp. Marseille-Q4943]
MMRKQNGMTLVEVLATLLISSLVIMLVWTTVTISMKHNIVETKKLQMQQEVNYIITDLQNIHRKSKNVCYQIKEEDGMWKIVECLNGDTISTYFNPKFNYELSGYPDMIFTKQKEAMNAGRAYSPSYSLSVKVSSLDDKGPILEISTTISRFDEQQ